MQVAFIGLGVMGRPMAMNIVGAAHGLTVFNRSADRYAGFAEAGAHIARSPRDAATDADVIAVCVSNPQALREVLTGDQGAIVGAKDGAIVVDFSTVDPATSVEMRDFAAAHGLGYLEAPVSGGSAGAHGGTLTIIAGGERQHFEGAKPVLDAVGKQVTLVGGVGAGSQVKLINQMLVGINLAGVVQAFVLGKAAGLDPALLYELIAKSSGASSSLNRVVPNNLLPRKYDPGFRVDLLLKDLGLGIDFANNIGVDFTLASAARDLFADAASAGFGAFDTSAAILPLEQRYGVRVGEEN